jgi:hypothetical protein
MIDSDAGHLLGGVGAEDRGALAQHPAQHRAAERTASRWRTA